MKARLSLFPLILGLLAVSPGSVSAKDPALGAAGVLEVQRGPLSTDIRLVGTLQARRVHEVHAPELPDRARLVVAVVAPAGGLIRRDQVVVAFEPAGPLRRVRRAEDRLALGRRRVVQLLKQQAAERLALSIQAERAGLELERAELLAVKGVGLESALREANARLDHEAARLQVGQEKKALEVQERRAKADLDLARLVVEEAEHDLSLARQVLERLVVRAPADGLVHLPQVRLRNGRGRVVAGVEVRPGSRLLEIHDPGDLIAVFEAEPDLLEALPAGTRVGLVPFSRPSDRLAGRVLGAEPICSGRDRARCRLGLRVAPGAGSRPLMPGGTVAMEARVVLDPDVLSLPARALVRRAGRPVVWSVDDRRWRAVRLGRNAGDRVEILAGLQVGERVSLDPDEAAAAGFEAGPEGSAEPK